MIHVTQLERDTILVCLDSEPLIDLNSSYPFMIFSGSALEGINTYFISFTKLFPLSFFVFPTTGCIKIVNLQGRLKSSRKLSAELTFNFQIENIGKQKQKDNMAWISSSGLLLIYKQTLICIVFPSLGFLFFPFFIQFASKTAYWRFGDMACRDGVSRLMR